MQVRKQAEDAIKQLSNRPEVIPQLVQQLHAAADPQVRQLSAVLLRKWIVRHWEKLPGEVSSRQRSAPPSPPPSPGWRVSCAECTWQHYLVESEHVGWP